MIYVSLLVLINLTLIAFAVLSLKKRKTNLHERDMIHHFGILELAWGTFSILLALFLMFDVFETRGDLSFLKAAGGIKLVSLMLLVGFGIIHSFIFLILLFKPKRIKTVEMN